MAFFKVFWKNQGKHRKLGDEWALAKNQDGELDLLPQADNNSENDSFKVKYLGRTPLLFPINNQSTTKAIVTILAVAKANRKKAQRVEVTLSMKGIEVVDLNLQKNILDISIFRISNCSADSTHSRVFAFHATNSQETTECYAFLCPKRGIAEQMAITVAKSFNAVYEAWLERQHFASNFEMKDAIITSNHINNSLNVNNKQENNNNLRTNNAMLIDMSTEKYKGNNWVSFENEQEESPKRIYQNVNKPAPDFVQANLFNGNTDWNEKNFIDFFAL